MSKTEYTLNDACLSCRKIISEISRVVIGKPHAIHLLVIALICGGHVLIEDVPGVGKTTVAAALARATGLDFKRIQLTPDVTASDITGFSVYDSKNGAFKYCPGVVMTNILIADEINRTSPKTQSALLEVMDERQVTVDGVTHEVPRPFTVIATENPIGFVGTYPLPEAQLDRFLLKFSLGYPSFEEEIKIVSDRKKENPLSSVSAVVTQGELSMIQKAASEIYVDAEIYEYAVKLVQATRTDKRIALAASPRATIALIRAASANALLNARNYVIPEDIMRLYKYTVAHRIMLAPDTAGLQGDAAAVLDSIAARIKMPVLKKQRDNTKC